MPPAFAIRPLLVLCLVAGGLPAAGCGGSHAASHSSRTRSPAASSPVRLGAALRIASLPAPREKAAAAAIGSDGIVVAGGLSRAGSSTATTFVIDREGVVGSVGALPAPIHDAAAAAADGQVLVFGGGTGGSDRVVQVHPGRPHQVARLPQRLTDLAAAEIGGSAYLVGGWNGSTANTVVYRARGAADPSPAGRLPLGVRHPATAAVAGRIVVAGGDDAAGRPTSRVSVFDPRSRRTTAVAALPAPIDHAAGAAVAGRFYLVGGVRAGAPSDEVLSWAPRERHFVRAGRLPMPLADAAAVSFGGGIAVIGGRGRSGPTNGVLLMGPR